MPALRVMRVALHAMFYVLLVIGCVGGGVTSWVLCAALGATYAFGGFFARPEATRRDGLLWLAAVTVLWVALAAESPGAGYVAFPLYFLYLHLLPPRWSLPSVALLTGVVVAAQSTTSGGLTAAKVIGPCAGAAVAVLTAYGYAGLYRESRRRQALIDDLVRTRDELAESQREAGRLAERARLAREIHDTLAQGLSSIVLLARSAESALPAGADAAAERVREIGATAGENLTEARRFVAALTPPSLQDATLPEALRRVTAGCGPVPQVAFHLDGEPCPLPVEAEVALLRLTQEALANVQRHARAQRAAVTLAYLDDQVTLDVFDDGVGFAPDAPAGAAGIAGAGGPSGGPRFGLHGMRERIAELGGTLTIESAPGEGTAVAAAIPLHGPSAPAAAPTQSTPPAQAAPSAQAAPPVRAAASAQAPTTPAAAPAPARPHPVERAS
ncbi:sensor histidine kinase [Streptacidiphilus neutrinimicus]|uniref:sensor histidine kinase n=1 Tax=Streptacidiphilus neutrinimicus TaxID=105420 RepID=UPI0007C7D37A|nr:sensor histidine kinase [Streptacidiphilus neutrinimicus]